MVINSCIGVNLDNFIVLGTLSLMLNVNFYKYLSSVWILYG